MAPPRKKRTALHDTPSPRGLSRHCAQLARARRSLVAVMRVKSWGLPANPRKSPHEQQIPDDAFGRMVSAIDDYAIFMISHDGRVLSWNRGAERIQGYSRDEVVGQHVSLFYPGIDGDA